MITRELQATLNLAVEEAARRRNEFFTLEHLLLALLTDRTARDVLVNCGCDLAKLRAGLEKFLAEHYESLEEYQPSEMPEQTIQFARVLQYALMLAEASGRRGVDGRRGRGRAGGGRVAARPARVVHRQPRRARGRGAHRSADRPLRRAAPH